MGRYFNWLAMTSVNLFAQHLDNVGRRKVFSNFHLCNCMIIMYSQLHCFTYNCTFCLFSISMVKPNYN
jgi:hypothetical protein